MIQISPAILTNEKSEFIRELHAYSAIFEQVDIDVNIDGDAFPGLTTESLTNVANDCRPFAKYLAFHLMVSVPEEIITLLFSKSDDFKSSKFYIHQESSFKKELLDLIPKESRGVAIELESDLRDIDFYNQFSEVQFMTIPIGFQGQHLEEESLSRVEQIKELGFKGKISIDGGVNLKTAKIIKKYTIDRVSVGSYFSKSKNIELDKMKLELALNIKERNNV